jgi:hypothetical protein
MIALLWLAERALWAWWSACYEAETWVGHRHYHAEARLRRAQARREWRRRGGDGDGGPR